MSFPRGKSFLKQLLSHSLYEVSIGFIGQFFLKMMLGSMSEWTKKFRREAASSMDDAMHCFLKAH